jgi:hypothetical protein
MCVRKLSVSDNDLARIDKLRATESPEVSGDN